MDPGSMQLETRDFPIEHEPLRNQAELDEIRLKKKEMTFPGPGIFYV
jgi:hypothetical protein